MNEIGEKVLSSYEKGVLKGLKRRDGDKIIEDKSSKATIERMLGQQVKYEMEDGTEVTATAEELVVASAIGDAIEKGSFDKIKTMMQVKGELSGTEGVKVEISLVDKDLEKRALE